MKRNILVIALALAFPACSHDVPEVFDLNTGTSATKTSFEVLREYDSNLRDEEIWSSIEDEARAEDSVTKATSTNLIGMSSGFLSCLTAGRIHSVIGTYESRDINGDPIRVSGRILYPKQGKIKNMIIVSHYTIGSNAEAPSESFSFEGIYAALGYVVVIADYIGFGVTKDMVHPYLQANTTARNVIDMAVAARPFLKNRGIVPESDEVILVGYSQGGATTMHVQRLLETDEEYAGTFKIKINYAGSGPYDIARTYDYSIEKDKTGIPCAIPMIIQGMSIGMERPLDMFFFFKEPLLTHYREWLNSKKYTVSQISALIGTNYLSEILTANARDKSNPETARFYQELRKNSIPNNYYPQAPVYMFHSEDDQTVPFVNSQLMQRQYTIYNVHTGGDVKVEYDFGHYGNHQQGALKFILKVAVILSKS